MSRIRIVVADQAEAIFYASSSLRARPEEVARITDPAAHLHNRDFESDRPGRSYESVGGARHAVGNENSPRRREAVRFARRISRRLDEARRQLAGVQLRLIELDEQRNLLDAPDQAVDTVDPVVASAP